MRVLRYGNHSNGYAQIALAGADRVETLRHALDALGRMGEQAESTLPLLRSRSSSMKGLDSVEVPSRSS